jgi:hypothetical protein
MFDKIIQHYLHQIYTLKELDGNDQTQDQLYYHLDYIFSFISKINSKRFFGVKETETTYMLIKEDVDFISDILLVESKVSLTDDIYYIIFLIFDSLREHCEREELYETASNLIKVRNFWFREMKVKIVNEVK